MIFSKINQFAQYFILTLICVSIALFVSPVSSELKMNTTQTSENNLKLTPKALFSNMQKAIISSNYSLNFYTEDGLLSLNDTNTFLYEHVNNINNEQARLVNLEGIPKEIILNKNAVSYFQNDVPPFSLSSRYIVDIFPDILFSDYTKLNKYYNFELIGKARVANKMTQIIQISSKQNVSYSYLLWIDESSYLPLRIDLLDAHSKIIYQFKVIQLSTDINPEALKQHISKLEFPPSISKDTSVDKSTIKWKTNWLPEGFKEIASSNIYYSVSELDSKLYSDGVFSFYITVSDKTENSKEISMEGATSIYSTDAHDKNIVIIGSLPLFTLIKIVDNLSF